MSTYTYSMKLDELAHFLNSSRLLLSQLDFLISYGIKRLEGNMFQWKNVDKKPSFDEDNPPYSYEEKNLYVNSPNRLWYETMWESSALSEIYYDALLTRIKQFTQRERFNFNKGIVYANLGVAQSAQKKLDEGFANILKALIEDSGYSDETVEYQLYRRNLFTQFEERYIKENLEKAVADLELSDTYPVEKFVQGFLDSLDDNAQRAFFDYTFTRIVQNWGIWKDKENSFTANRLLAYIQDFCLFNEDFLRRKTSPNILKNRPRWELGPLISVNFCGINIQDCSANTLDELDKKLPLELSNKNKKERCLRILLILRNYSSHNVSGGTSMNYLYSCYEMILTEIIRALCNIQLLPKYS